MKHIKRVFWGLLLGLCVLWVGANLVLPSPMTSLEIFKLLVQFSGTLTIGVMSAAMILATRSQWLEQRLNGLDKTYRLHKWFGISALILAVSHWVLMRVAEGNGHDEATIGQTMWPVPEAEMGAVQHLLHGLHDTAGGLGNPAFYPFIILAVLALIKRVRYKFFASAHMLLAITYLFGAFHSVVLMEFHMWVHPIGIVVAMLIAGGVMSALLTLSRQIGRRNRSAGVIKFVQRFVDVRVISSHIKMDARWKGHKAGQFAFVTFNRKEGKHPFTIASAWDPSSREIMVVTRGLGDYTDRLPEGLMAGDTAMIEGPYGCFTFDDSKARQIWIAGGIGITPFIARMKHIAENPSDQKVDLFYAVSSRHAELEELLMADIEAANVTLHPFVDDEQKSFTPEILRETVRDWNNASVWFCGPGPFGKAVRKDLVSHGLPPDDFHQELFNMR